jgi:hypothetical protein
VHINVCLSYVHNMVFSENAVLSFTIDIYMFPEATLLIATVKYFE